MWYGEMCVHLYDLLDVLAAKATATTEATETRARAPLLYRSTAFPVFFVLCDQVIQVAAAH